MALHETNEDIDWTVMNGNNKKIGIILDILPTSGGGFQYALNVLWALKAIVRDEGMMLCAFYLFDAWKEYIDNDKDIIIKKPLSGKKVIDINVIDGGECDIIFSTSEYGAYTEWIATPVVFPVHDLMHVYESRFPEVGGGFETRNRSEKLIRMIHNAIGVLADSDVGVEQICECYGNYYKHKIHVLPFAAPGYILEASETADISFDKYIFYPAQFWLHKNHKNLLLAISMLKKRGIIVNCVFVGSKKNGYEEAKRIIDECGLSEQVIILGYVSNPKMRYLYENARALVMPTYFGPTNIPPIEAITTGCPVAVSGIYGMPAQLGSAAIYFEPDNIESIARSIERLWVDDGLCDYLRKMAYEKKKEFGLDHFTDNLRDILFRLLPMADDIKEKLAPIKTFCNNRSHIYVYGAGMNGMYVCRILEKMHICVEGVFVTKNEDESEISIAGKTVVVFDNHLISSSDGIVCAVSDVIKNEVRQYLLDNEVVEDNILLIDDDETILLYQTIGM